MLRSILEHIKGPQLVVSVVWRATEPHIESYLRLSRLYRMQGVRFYQQSGSISFLRHILPKLWMPRNLYHWIKHKYIRKSDNFKPLLEGVIANTQCSFVAFNTDDNIYYKDEVLPAEALDYVRNAPYDASYRTIQGCNLSDSPADLVKEAKLIKWDYYSSSVRNSWSYPFSVDGQFFEKTALLSVIQKILYHNPVTLEAYTVSYVKSKKLFRSGYGPTCSSMVAVPLNKVSYIVPDNTRGDLPLELLSKLFLEGYTLDYKLCSQQTEREYIPKEVTAVRGKERIVLRVSRYTVGSALR